MTTNHEVVTMLVDYFYDDRAGQKFSDNKMRIYLKTLADIAPEILEQAAFEHIKKGSPYFPRVSELREIAMKVTKRMPEDLHCVMYWRAMEAFSRSQQGELPADTPYSDPRYSRFFRAPAEPSEWWDTLPEPAKTMDEYEARYPIEELEPA